MKITSAREAVSQVLSADDKVGECLLEVGASRDLIVRVRVKKGAEAPSANVDADSENVMRTATRNLEEVD
jgi:hypothetical protein